MKKNRGTMSGRKSMAVLEMISLTMCFVLALFAVLVISGLPEAKADEISDAGLSNAAYINDDCLGIDQAAKSVFYVQVLNADGRMPPDAGDRVL